MLLNLLNLILHLSRLESEVDFRRGTSCYGSSHTGGQEVETELERSIGPSESFPVHAFEVKTLVTVLGVNKMGEGDRVEFLGNDSVVVDAERREANK